MQLEGRKCNELQYACNRNFVMQLNLEEIVK